MIRSRKEKKEEVKKIIEKLTELKLTVIYDPVHKLLKELQKYVQEDNDIKINIPFPEIKKHIEGFLPINPKCDCWIRLTNSK